MRTATIGVMAALLLGLVGSAPAGLVAHYQFEGNANDSSGNGLHGVLVGAATLIGDRERGKVLSLNGGHVDCGTDPRLNPGSALTVACWIKVGAFDKAWQAIITKGDYGWRLQRDNTNSGLEFACTGVNVPGTTWGNILGSTNVDDGKWHHVAGVFNGATIGLYVDGVLDRSATATGAISFNAWAVWIGANAQVAGRQWVGLIDDVRIYSHALSAAEVAALAGVAGARPGGPGGGLSPLASAFIDATGKVMSGTPNVLCTLTSSWKYEITIVGETYTA
ncbi:MAG: LamG domain-containing protein, partial [Planctomycetes bacterium]|nr:LamG domain-containing protein [Planctomycetota bacterium]